MHQSAPVARTRIASLPPPRIIRSIVPSPPRIIRETAPRQQPRNLPVSKPTQVVDPFKQWSELATLGQQTVAFNDDKQIQQTETVANRVEQPNTVSSTQVNSSSPVYREVSFQNNSNNSKSNINKRSSIPIVAVNSTANQTRQLRQARLIILL